jgi:class 3 adenylate cyclase/CHASE2 domain-containing sensor protein
VQGLRPGELLPTAAIAGFAAALGLLAPRWLPHLGAIESQIADLRAAALSAPAPQHPAVVVVAITEDTLAQLPYRSPVDRRFLARLLRTLDQARARAIGLDILFDQPTEAEKDDELRVVLGSLRAPVVVAYAGQGDRLTQRQTAYLGRYLSGIGKGYATLVTDPIDGVVRRLYPGRADDGAGGYVAGLAAALGAAVGAPAPREAVPLAYRASPAAGTSPFRSFPAHAVGLLPKAWFAGKIVLVGADLPHSDRFPTPFAAAGGYGETMPGVVVHAHALAQLLDGRRAPGLGLGGETAFVAVVAVLGLALAALPLGVPSKVGAGALGLAVLWIGGFAAFKWAGAMAPLVAPTLAFAVSGGAGSFYRERRERTQRKFISAAFGRYLSPTVVQRLAENPGELRLGGEQKELTVLFLDVRGFTAISERFTPTGLTRLINALLTPLTEAILRRGGTVDKYMGDAVMAFWNAPLDDASHARNACLAALDMVRAMGPLNERLEKEARDEGRAHAPLKIGVGLNSGPAVVGNMGSEQRFDYSCLGDTVNTASRLEGQSKTYGVGVVLGPATAAAVPELATLELDLIRVKGKTAALRIHALLGDEATKGDPAFAELEAAHADMLAAYRGRDWRAAEAGIAACRRLCRPLRDLDALYDLYAERIREFVSDPPGAAWDGVYEARTK